MGAVVPNWKEFRFKIEGKVGEEELTPLTLPMARLAEYLTDLATIMGHKESVHFVATDEGSAVSIIYVDAEEEVRVTSQIRNAARGMGPHYANEAYTRLDGKLREDDAIGDIINASQKATIIEFPGKRTDLPEPYGPIKEKASLIGVLKRVGGFDESVPVHLQRADGVIFCCEADPAIAKKLIVFYEKTIRVHGIANYRRGKEGMWEVTHFKIHSYDPEPLAEDSFSQTIEKLRAIPGSEWNDLDDPLEELRRLRHGEEENARL
jgi:hypothetical protein